MASFEEELAELQAELEMLYLIYTENEMMLYELLGAFRNPKSQEGDQH